jgi:hypothetical protein
LIVKGKNRKLQGLAAAILKLWEKSLIVKIALKWGIPNTNKVAPPLDLPHMNTIPVQAPSLLIHVCGA